MNIVKIEKLVKRFDETVAVDRVSLEIREGEIYGLLGPNGAGKSTLINVMCGLLKKNEGSVHIFDKNIDFSMMEIKQDLGIVPQEIALYEDLTAKENVKFFASLYGLKGSVLKEKTAEALEFVGLIDHANKLARTFSGGMKRRLNIACAIAHQPKLIIMDEPTVGIDPQSRNHILNSVKKLNQLGTTVIYTTHYMEEAEFLCSRIGIIDYGKLIAEGTNQELQNLVTDRKTIVVKTSIGKTYDLRELSEIKGVLDANVKDSTVIIETLRETDAVGDIVRFFEKNELPILDIQMKNANLETIFLSLTGRKLRQ